MNKDNRHHRHQSTSTVREKWYHAPSLCWSVPSGVKRFLTGFPRIQGNISYSQFSAYLVYEECRADESEQSLKAILDLRLPLYMKDEV